MFLNIHLHTCWCFKYVWEGTQKFPELLQKIYLKYLYKLEFLCPFQVIPALLPLLATLSDIFNGNAIKGCQQFLLNLCKVSKMPPFQILLHPWVQKSVTRGKARWVGGGTQPPFCLVKNCSTLKVVWPGALSWYKNQFLLCHFLDVFVTGAHAIISPNSRKTPDLLFVLEEQTPCALSHQHQKKKSTFSCHYMYLLCFFWSERLLWLNTDVTAALTQGYSSSTNSHLLLQLLWETEGHIWAVPANHSKHSCASL